MYKSLLLISLLFFSAVSCSDLLSFDNSFNKTPPGDNNTQDNSTKPPFTDNSSGDTDTPPTPDGPGSGGDTPPAPDIPTGLCDPATVSKPIKRILAGAIDGMIYYSEDSGNTWNPSTQPQGTKEHIWHAFADLGNDIVIAGSRDYRGNSTDFGTGKGILRSTDGGKTWVTTNITSGQWNDIFYVGDGIVLAGSYSQNGVWRSIDYGKTWVQNTQKDINMQDPPCWAPDGIGNNDVSGFAILNDGRLITGRAFTYQGTPFPISISSDKGETWCKADKFPGSTPKSDFINQALVLMNGALVLATHYDKHWFDFKERDGIPVSPLNGQLIFWYEADLKAQYNFYSLAQLRNGVVIAGGGKPNSTSHTDLKHSGIWRSLDNASEGSFKVSKMDKYQWRSIVALDNCDAIASCYPIVGGGSEFECKSSLYKSTDSGNEWKPMNNFPHYIFKLGVVR